VTPDLADLVAVDRARQLGVRGGQAARRRRQVEAQAEAAAGLVVEGVDLLLGGGPALEREHLEVLERRRVELVEAVQLEVAAQAIEHRAPRAHLDGKNVARAFRRLKRFAHGGRSLAEFRRAGW